MPMGGSGFGPAGLYNSDPSSGEFTPGIGLSMVTRTNANAVQATTAKPTSGASPLKTVVSDFRDHPLTWFVAAGVVLLVHKAISERHSDGHVADVRIGATNFLMLPIYVVAGIWFYRWVSGAAAGHGLPGAEQVATFFS